MTAPNVAPFDPATFVGRPGLADSVLGRPTIEQFKAAGMTFDLRDAGYFRVEDEIQKAFQREVSPDGQHIVALHEGYRFCRRLVAVGPDNEVYAVWEIYTKSSEGLFAAKSRTIEVDGSWTKRGIGTAFAEAVRRHFDVEWSTRFTPAGANLKERVEARRASGVAQT